MVIDELWLSLWSGNYRYPRAKCIKKSWLARAKWESHLILGLTYTHQQGHHYLSLAFDSTHRPGPMYHPLPFHRSPLHPLQRSAVHRQVHLKSVSQFSRFLFNFLLLFIIRAHRNNIKQSLTSWSCKPDSPDFFFFWHGPSIPLASFIRLIVTEFHGYILQDVFL